MPLYEYRCGSCNRQFEATQPVHARPEDTACPHCKTRNATRLLSSFSSKVVGSRKPGFAELKADSMLHERMEKFAKLPPLTGQRAAVTPNMTGAEGSNSGGEA